MIIWTHRAGDTGGHATPSPLPDNTFQCSMRPYFEIHFASPDTEVSNLFLEQFCSLYNLKSLINEPTHFKSVDNPSCIDLILTNHPKCFQNSGVYETGISDFHKLTFTVLKTYFQKAKPRFIKYRDYKHFDNNEFRDELIRELSSNNMQYDDLTRFTNIS